ncbi:MAG: pyruvate kinase [Vicinamibacterales bacterium]
MTSPLHELLRELGTIDAALTQVDRASGPFLSELPATQLPSATNLLHYLVLRRRDLRQAQRLLAAHGLSSLGRTESHVRSGLDAVLRALHVLEGQSWSPSQEGLRLTLEDGEALIAGHTDELLGPRPEGRTVRIMVTMPTEAAHDYTLVRDLVTAGMDCMRVNCAHDGPAEWARMIAHLRRASADVGRPCSVCMDIGGPKLRTGPIEPGPPVQKIRPRRDPWGRVFAPATVAIVPSSSAERSRIAADATLAIDHPLPPTVVVDSRLDLVDARGRRRRLRVLARQGDLVLAALPDTAYVAPGTALYPHGEEVDVWRVVDTPPQEQAILLRTGDELILTPEDVLGRPALFDERGRVLVAGQIGVTLPAVFEDARPGECIWFDDGRIGGTIRTVEPDRVRVEITHARPAGEKLRAGKGINLPDTNLRLGALTAKDREDLRFIAAHADLVGYSFVRTAGDVEALQAELAALGGTHLGIVLKIETQRAFEELPRLLLTCMRTGRFGVMIARGDLAIECGYERMAEVQEEILWIAEAAHAPVIWGTQVLESLAKTGVPSRAEVTDAAMAERAEAVMLNKGPFIRQAVRTLDDILRRMQAHQTKKRAMLRPLRVASLIADALGTPASR